jgi:hypothetical protein
VMWMAGMNLKLSATGHHFACPRLSGAEVLQKQGLQFF